MNTSSRLGTSAGTKLVEAGARWDSRTPFNLLVAYEDQSTRDRALHLSQRLAQQLGEDYDFHCSWWKFEHLANATLHEQAAKAAVEANMIVLSLHARPIMSALQSRWIDAWTPRRKSVKGALVALVARAENTTEQPVEATTDFLRKIARASHLDFFAHSFELPLQPDQAQPAFASDQDAPPPQTHTQAQGGLMALESPAASASEVIAPAPVEQDQHFFKMPIPRWGINE
jgi:hypothetical protein